MKMEELEEFRARGIKEGTNVVHFKRTLMSDEEAQKDRFKYIYEVIGLAQHTESAELLVLYRAVGSYEAWARPVSSFFGKVDMNKYPLSKQEYTFEPYVGDCETYYST